MCIGNMAFELCLSLAQPQGQTQDLRRILPQQTQQPFMQGVRSTKRAVQIDDQGHRIGCELLTGTGIQQIGLFIHHPRLFWIGNLATGRKTMRTSDNSLGPQRGRTVTRDTTKTRYNAQGKPTVMAGLSQSLIHAMVYHLPCHYRQVAGREGVVCGKPARNPNAFSGILPPRRCCCGPALRFDGESDRIAR